MSPSFLTFACVQNMDRSKTFPRSFYHAIEEGNHQIVGVSEERKEIRSCIGIYTGSSTNFKVEGAGTCLFVLCQLRSSKEEDPLVTRSGVIALIHVRVM